MLIYMLPLLQSFAELTRIADYLCYSWILPSVSEFPFVQIFSCYKDVLFSDPTRIKHVTYFDS